MQLGFGARTQKIYKGENAKENKQKQEGNQIRFPFFR